jgi:hypothetical protein
VKLHPKAGGQAERQHAARPDIRPKRGTPTSTIYLSPPVPWSRPPGHPVA